MTAVVRIEELPGGLDWEAFTTLCFPGGRRHDLEVVAAYGAYKRFPLELDDGWVRSDAVDAWEEEGGATSEGPLRSGRSQNHVAAAKKGSRRLLPPFGQKGLGS
jgi:hypothetical protein